MRITQITINFTETCNLGDYSNTKPSVELTAQLDAGDDVKASIDELVATAKGVIHEKIDEELERVDKPPKYWQGDRYDVIYSHNTNFVAIVPTGVITQLDGGFYTMVEGVRHQAARKAAERRCGPLIGNPNRPKLFNCGTVSTVQEIREYVTSQNAIYEQKQQAKRQAEEEERRQRQAEWENRYVQVEPEEDDDETFGTDEDDEDSTT